MYAIDDIVITPDESQPDGTHRLRVASIREDGHYVMESLVSGMFLVMRNKEVVE